MNEPSPTAPLTAGRLLAFHKVEIEEQPHGVRYRLGTTRTPADTVVVAAVVVLATAFVVGLSQSELPAEGASGAFAVVVSILILAAIIAANVVYHDRTSPRLVELTRDAISIETGRGWFRRRRTFPLDADAAELALTPPSDPTVRAGPALGARLRRSWLRKFRLAQLQLLAPAAASLVEGDRSLLIALASDLAARARRLGITVTWQPIDAIADLAASSRRADLDHPPPHVPCTAEASFRTSGIRMVVGPERGRDSSVIYSLVFCGLLVALAAGVGFVLWYEVAIVASLLFAPVIVGLLAYAAARRFRHTTTLELDERELLVTQQVLRTRRHHFDIVALHTLLPLPLQDEVGPTTQTDLLVILRDGRLHRLRLRRRLETVDWVAAVLRRELHLAADGRAEYPPPVDSDTDLTAYLLIPPHRA